MLLASIKYSLKHLHQNHSNFKALNGKSSALFLFYFFEENGTMG